MQCTFCNRINSEAATYCGACGKILMISYGRTDAICPYCENEFSRRPLAKTKCKSCSGYVYVRTRPTDKQRILLTEADAELVEIQWATQNNRLEWYLEEKQKKNEARAVLLKKLGREPSKGAIQIEYLKTRIPQNREKSRQRLLERPDCFTGWEWVASKQTRCCAFCIAMDGKTFSLDVSFDSVNRCESEYCRCDLIAVIDGVDRPPRDIGSDWFATLPDSDKIMMLGDERFREYSNRKTLDEIFQI